MKIGSERQVDGVGIIERWPRPVIDRHDLVFEEFQNVQKSLRNIAIIAHVDHGKTSLVDGLLKQSNVFRDPDTAGDLILDASDLERERGITILSKNASIRFGEIDINIVDTPGHVDFGGEVERVLNMADGCLLVVDAVEGPMPQTRSVLAQALALGLRPVVVINKIDRPASRPEEVVSMVQDLFLELATDTDQLDFPVLYAIAKEGKSGYAPDALQDNLLALLNTIVEHVPAPGGDPEGPFQMLIASLDYDTHRGRIVIGRVRRGRVSVGDTVIHIAPDGTETVEKVSYIAKHVGLGRVAIETAEAGDIIALAGSPGARIGATLTDPAHRDALPAMEIEEPTLSLTFGVNTSPLSGREGKFSTSRQLRERLFRELETNMALRVEPTDQPDVFSVAGRGELHLSILIETMRREGYEFQVSKPEVVTKEIDGKRMEPIEHLYIDTVDEHVGTVTELVGSRRARMLDMVSDNRGSVRLEFSIPTRGLIGLRSAMLNATRGTAMLSSQLTGYEPWQGVITSSRTGALVASEGGQALAFGLLNAQDRGITFVEPGVEVYEGMIVGQHPREGDLPVNVCRGKKLTNMRASSADTHVRLSPPVEMSLEQALDFLGDDELLEVTPKNLRLRKQILGNDDRIKARRRTEGAARR
ncbi:MAG: translational GTPase TypA [Sphaerobacteraceae bacterium]|nr:MAG: translational GTPase TypA [Sphaerobacteraceae bacterium]